MHKNDLHGSIVFHIQKELQEHRKTVDTARNPHIFKSMILVVKILETSKNTRWGIFYWRNLIHFHWLPYKERIYVRAELFIQEEYSIKK